jgi:hypothetical protein
MSRAIRLCGRDGAAQYLQSQTILRLEHVITTLEPDAAVLLVDAGLLAEPRSTAGAWASDGCAAIAFYI